MKARGCILVQHPATKMYYARSKGAGTITFQEPAEETGGISTTVSDTDVLAVLNEVDKAVARHLEEGRIIHLSGIHAPGRLQFKRRRKRGEVPHLHDSLPEDPPFAVRSRL